MMCRHLMVLSNMLRVATKMRMADRGHLMIWIVTLGTTIALTRSWALDFATLLGVDSLVLLLSNGTSDAAIDSTDGSNWQVVVLLRSQIVLIQNKFTLFVQLFVKWFVMQVHVDMGKVSLETGLYTAMARRGIVHFLVMSVPLWLDRYCLNRGLSFFRLTLFHLIITSRTWLLNLLVPWLHVRLRAHTPSLAILWFSRCLAIMSYIIWVFLLHILPDIIISNFRCHSRVDWVQILSLAERFLVWFRSTLRSSLVAINCLWVLKLT
mgnify:CR=1 FL=1